MFLQGRRITSLFFLYKNTFHNIYRGWNLPNFKNIFLKYKPKAKILLKGYNFMRLKFC